MRKFLKFNWPHKRIIYDRDGLRPYMIRYYLLFRGKKEFQDQSQKFPFNIYLHRILLSDEPVFHDHPWDWGTIVIKGGYFEPTPEVRFWRGPGSLRLARASDLHFLEIKPQVPCLTLFFRGRTKRVWGFATVKGWLDYKAYLALTKVS